MSSPETTSAPAPVDEAEPTDAPASPEPPSPMSEALSPESANPSVPKAPPVRPVFDDPQVGLWGRFIRWGENKFSELSVKNNFWHRLCSYLFLPISYRSGIKFRHAKANTLDDGPFECVVPFSRFNKNWYNAMAGAALLANSEVAGGMFIFQKCGSDYTVVCKHLEYKFRRPCVGPAIYRVDPREDIEPLVATGDEFNITVDLTILQAVVKKDEKERKVGMSTATFHVTPKAKYRARKAKQAERAAAKKN
ncbi:MAG: hypothetical protein AAGJ38_08125 [Planctomycetota bacterium]